MNFPDPGSSYSSPDGIDGSFSVAFESLKQHSQARPAIMLLESRLRIEVERQKLISAVPEVQDSDWQDALDRVSAIGPKI